MSPNRQNNFGPLRLVLAVAVMYSHSWPITGCKGEPLETLTGSVTFGTLAVNGFFLISGLLVTQSWHRSRGVGDFLRKRAARLYPGFWLAIVLTGVLAALAYSDGPAKYLKKSLWDAGDIASAVLFFDKPTGLPLSYLANPFPNIVNGSLWTLPFEVRCYLLVIALGSLGLLKRPTAAGIVALGSFIPFAGTALLSGPTVADESLWRFVVYFAAGSWVAVVGVDRMPLGWLPCLVSLTGLVASLYAGRYAQLLFPLFGSHLILSFAFARPLPGAGWFDRHDMSYGCYLYAWPIQQSITYHGHVYDPMTNFAMALPVTLAVAWVSWRWIESPVLKRVRGNHRHPAAPLSS